MREKFWRWLAWKLPRRLVYWCAIRLLSAATLPPYGDQIVPGLLALVALERWESCADGNPNPDVPPEEELTNGSQI